MESGLLLSDAGSPVYCGSVPPFSLGVGLWTREQERGDVGFDMLTRCRNRRGLGDTGVGFAQNSLSLRPRQKRTRTHCEGYLLAGAVKVDLQCSAACGETLRPQSLLLEDPQENFKARGHEEQASARGSCPKLRSIGVSVSMDNLSEVSS